VIDEDKLRDYVARRRNAQNLGMGIAGGIIGAALGALAWAAITALTQFQIGFMAIGVGFLTGFGVRILGKGIDKIFGYVGAVLSLAGCVVGNILTAVIYISTHDQVPFGTVLSHLTPNLAWQILTQGANVIDLFFYGIALYFGYRYSFQRITPDELTSLRTDEPQPQLQAQAGRSQPQPPAAPSA
jgi:hypothetical protein